MAALKGRIARLRELGMMKATELNPGNPPGEALPDVRVFNRGFLPGWKQVNPYVHVRVIDTSLEFSSPSGKGASEYIDLRHFEWESEVCTPWPIENISFLDFETTGLSGGTGTIAFLAAIGYFEEGNFHLAQIFLDDFPGEADFLREVLALLARRPYLVTYNGKAFDYPLLRTRCVMNSMKAPEISGHIDALHISRRLWKRTIGPCSLKALEEAVLGQARGEDIPGFLIPGIWLDYVSTKGPPSRQIETVVEHNAKDVDSLARLFLRIRKIMDNPVDLAINERVDAARLARGLLRTERGVEGLSLLEEAAAGGDQRALRMLVRYYRRLRQMELYALCVSSLDEQSLEGRIEKAKYEEHFARNYEAALDHVRQALKMTEACNEKLAAMLRHREARIIGKLEKPRKI